MHHHGHMYRHCTVALEYYREFQITPIKTKSDYWTGNDSLSFWLDVRFLPHQQYEILFVQRFALLCYIFLLLCFPATQQLINFFLVCSYFLTCLASSCLIPELYLTNLFLCVKKMEREKLEKLKRKAEKEMAEKAKENTEKKSEGTHKD
ncbi:hypothetical protein F2P56_031944 [Juglans regia]|uniref:Uncharacterized protein n=1 Tax=Juglans regia TaxID=51240 RepID=A0A833TWZ7_JUGRE|nr:hypothetical protein F2P56_031944 [Juglans regia]